MSVVRRALLLLLALAPLACEEAAAPDAPDPLAVDGHAFVAEPAPRPAREGGPFPLSLRYLVGLGVRCHASPKMPAVGFGGRRCTPSTCWASRS